jgi:peptidylprolyl isomerase
VLVRRRLLALTVVSLLLFGTAACGDDGAPKADGSSATSGTGDEISGLTVSGEVGTEPKVKVEGLKVDEVLSEVVTAGEGNPVVAGKDALLHIYLAKGSTGEKAATTYDQGAPVDLKMDESQLFKPVLDAIVGKQQGSRVAIAAPVKDVYGSEGASQIGLKPADTVVFVIDIISVPPKEVVDGPSGDQADTPGDIPAVVEQDGEVTGFDWSKAPKKAPAKLQVIPLVEGDGPVARDDSLVTFDYFGEVYGADKPFDESFSKEPVTFPLGMGGLIQAWDKGLVGLKRGSRVMIIAPPGVAYGDQARPGIPADSTLVFVVDILGVDG